MGDSHARQPASAHPLRWRNVAAARRGSPPAPALVVESDAQAWAEFLAARGEDRAAVFARMRVAGGDDAVAFFRQAFRIPVGA